MAFQSDELCEELAVTSRCLMCLLVAVLERVVAQWVTRVIRSSVRVRLYPLMQAFGAMVPWIVLEAQLSVE